MTAPLVSFVRIGMLALVVGAGGCDLIDGIFDDKPDPKPEPKACTSSDVCGAGSFCTVESGVCNPPPGCDPGEICPAICYGTCEPRPAAQCHGDGDCRTFGFMCTGCDCVALGQNDREPTCAGPGVQCFADPCLGKKAVCDGGRCVIGAAATCGAGSVAQRVCVQCGPAGGCARESDCPRVCRQDSDCASEQTGCIDGLCQVRGCI